MQKIALMTCFQISFSSSLFVYLVSPSTNIYSALTLQQYWDQTPNQQHSSPWTIGGKIDKLLVNGLSKWIINKIHTIHLEPIDNEYKWMDLDG